MKKIFVILLFQKIILKTERNIDHEFQVINDDGDLFFTKSAGNTEAYWCAKRLLGSAT